jgi:hypothetical protein
MTIKKFAQLNENKLISFNEAFDMYIKGQIAIGQYYVSEFGDHKLPPEERFYGNGIVFENGYKYLAYGGGASGEDYNVEYIVSPDDKLIAKEE